MRPTLEPSPDRMTLLVAVLALAAALAGQSAIASRPYWGLAGFAVAALLMAVVARREPAPNEPAPAPPPALTRGFLALVLLGVALCIAAGVLVYRMQPALLTHCVWAGGLLVLAAAAVLSGGGPPVIPLDRRTVLTGAALAALAALVFGWDLTTLPVEVHGDDAEVGLDAMRLLAHFNLFGAGWFELPRFHALPTMLGLQLFGINLLGLRATSAALGIGSRAAALRGRPPAVELRGRRLWRRCCSSRNASSSISVAPAITTSTRRSSVCWCVWLFLRLWQDRRLGAAIWCGIALGLGIQTYYASRWSRCCSPLTWVLWLSGTPTRRAVAARSRCSPSSCSSPLAVAAPIFGYFAHDWGAFWERTRDTSMFTAGRTPPPGVRLPHRQPAQHPADPAARRRRRCSTACRTTRCSTASTRHCSSR